MQISDTHLSAFDDQPDHFKSFGDKSWRSEVRSLFSHIQPSMCCIMAQKAAGSGIDRLQQDRAAVQAIAQTVLAAAKPGALLITGDLTDAKSQIGRGEQLEQDWQVRGSSRICLHVTASAHSIGVFKKDLDRQLSQAASCQWVLQMYRAALDVISAESGIPEASILDLRGTTTRSAYWKGRLLFSFFYLLPVVFLGSSRNPFG